MTQNGNLASTLTAPFKIDQTKTLIIRPASDWAKTPPPINKNSTPSVSGFNSCGFRSRVENVFSSSFHLAHAYSVIYNRTPIFSFSTLMWLPFAPLFPFSNPILPRTSLVNGFPHRHDTTPFQCHGISVVFPGQIKDIAPLLGVSRTPLYASPE